MISPFTLAVCAEMLWQDKSMDWRLRRLTELGFQCGIWNWDRHDLGILEFLRNILFHDWLHCGPTG